MDKNQFSPLKNLKNDLPAGLIVSLVAVPLCLGIALASGAPLFSGIIAGIVGGIIVGVISGSPLGVSGPAAGLAVIVLTAIQDLGAFDVFLMSVVIAGALQFIFGLLQGGIVAYYFPSSVIKGMLAGIGVIIFLKQIPHALGYDKDYNGSLAFTQPDGQNTFSEIFNVLGAISSGPLVISLVCLAILVLWERPFMKKNPIFSIIQGPLVVVAAGIVLNLLFIGSSLSLSADQMVSIPVASSLEEFFSFFQTPDFSAWNNPQVWITAATIAVVASLETLLCLEATDKLDPHKRVSPANLELKAQGIGNLVSGMIGGLPVTQVIVRSSTNIQAGGRTKTSAIFHGFILLFAAMLIPGVLNMVPLASLAAILLLVGYKLAKPTLFKQMYNLGISHFAPFAMTVSAIVLTDLLTGIAIGMGVAVFYILYDNYRKPFLFEKEEDGTIRINMAQDVSFLNRANIQKALNVIPDESKVIIDTSKTANIHPDVLDVIEDFKINAGYRDIDLKIIEAETDFNEISCVNIFEKTVAPVSVNSTSK